MPAPIPILYTIPNFAPAVCLLKRGGRVESEIDRLGVPYLVASPELRCTMDAAGRARILVRFSIEREVKAYEDLYTEGFGRAASAGREH